MGLLKKAEDSSHADSDKSGKNNHNAPPLAVLQEISRQKMNEDMQMWAKGKGRKVPDAADIIYRRKQAIEMLNNKPRKLQVTYDEET